MIAGILMLALIPKTFGPSRLSLISIQFLSNSAIEKSKLCISINPQKEE